MLMPAERPPQEDEHAIPKLWEKNIADPHLMRKHWNAVVQYIRETEDIIAENSHPKTQSGGKWCAEVGMYDSPKWTRIQTERHESKC